VIRSWHYHFLFPVYFFMSSVLVVRMVCRLQYIITSSIIGPPAPASRSLQSSRRRYLPSPSSIYSLSLLRHGNNFRAVYIKKNRFRRVLSAVYSFYINLALAVAGRNGHRSHVNWRPLVDDGVLGKIAKAYIGNLLGIHKRTDI